MIAVVKCYKHNIKPLVVEVFEGHDEQTQKDAKLLLYKINQTHKIRWK